MLRTECVSFDTTNGRGFTADGDDVRKGRYYGLQGQVQSLNGGNSMDFLVPIISRTCPRLSGRTVQQKATHYQVTPGMACIDLQIKREAFGWFEGMEW